ARHGLRTELATRRVDDLLVAGQQRGVGEGVQHRPRAEEMIGVTVRHEDRAGSRSGLLHPRRKPLALIPGEERVDEEPVPVGRDQRRRRGRPRGGDAVVPARSAGYRLVATVENIDGQRIRHVDSSLDYLASMVRGRGGGPRPWNPLAGTRAEGGTRTPALVIGWRDGRNAKAGLPGPDA